MKRYYTILGRRWFDKPNGNTYHSVKVYENGVLIGKNDFEYGYDEQYKQTALNILHKNNIAKEFNMLWHFADAIDREKVLCDVVDVSRRKDLN